MELRLVSLLVFLLAVHTAGFARELKTRRALNREWFSRRKEGTAPTRRRRPRSKRELRDHLLYEVISIDPSVQFAGLTGKEIEREAERRLARICAAPGSAAIAAIAAAAAASAAPVPEEKEDAPRAAHRSAVMWGACSVGPLLRARLEEAQLSSPLPIQEAAFEPIVKGRNALISSQTGSGKTLAFMLPLLAKARRDQ
eukprot:5799102-Pleurochrysis_carterae.AAC.3